MYVHSKVASQLDYPNGAKSNLDDAEEKDEADDDWGVEGESRGFGPLGIAAPGEVVVAECAWHGGECLQSV